MTLLFQKFVFLLKGLQRRKSLAVLHFLLVISTVKAQDNPVAKWDFENNDGIAVLDNAGSISDTIRGNFWLSEGVIGKCLKFDGYTTHVVRPADNSLDLGSAFTI